MRRGAWFLGLLFGCGLAVAGWPIPGVRTTPEVSPAWNTTHVFYIQRSEHWFPVCMTTPFEQEGDTTFFVTAAHCLQGDAYAISREITETPPLRAVPVAVHKGKDLAVLRTSGVRVETLPLGDDPIVGEAVITVTTPLMLERLLSTGVTASEAFAIQDEWERAMFFYIHGAMGESGGAIYSPAQGAICAILVGNIVGLDAFSIGVPVSALKEMIPYLSNHMKGE